MLLHAACLLLATLGPAPQDGSSEILDPPRVGSVAPSMATVYWYTPGRIPALEDLRGEVVLVHTWGYYCGPCMRTSVPYVVDLMEANRERGLRAFSITVPVGDGMPDDHFVKVAEEVGMKHPQGAANGFGDMTPYLNMNAASALTWCFVIGREGGVRWAGNPSREGEEFLEAVASALGESLPPLPPSPPEALDKAIAQYVLGSLTKARVEADKALQRAHKKKVGGEAIAAYATQVLAAIEGMSSDLLGRLEAATTAKDPTAFVEARATLRRHFPKGEEAKELKRIEKGLKADKEFAGAVAAAETWRELRSARPALFPVRRDKVTEKYAKQLTKYAKGRTAGAPGLAEVRGWLAEFEKATPRE